jgi:hypothetical protein
MNLFDHDLAAGNIVECSVCNKRSYYPFQDDLDRPFYKKKSWWFYGLLLGLMSTLVSDWIHALWLIWRDTAVIILG